MTSNVDKLSYYLSQNNCEEEADFKGCYREARLILITTTKELDAANDRINNLNKVVDKMTGNVTAIIDNLNDDTAEKISTERIAAGVSATVGKVKTLVK